MDIAAMSMDMSAARLQMQVGVSVTKKAMETSEIEAAGLYSMMDAAAQTIPSEHLIDVKA